MMTPKERREAVIELKDMAFRLEQRAVKMDGDMIERGHRFDRAKMLRAVAAELDRVPESQS